MVLIQQDPRLCYSGNVTSSMLPENSWVTISRLPLLTIITGNPNLVVLVETNFGDYGGESFDARKCASHPRFPTVASFGKTILRPQPITVFSRISVPTFNLHFKLPVQDHPTPVIPFRQWILFAAGESFTLSLQNISITPGLEYDWQSSPNGTSSWTDLPGGTNSTYTTSQTAKTYYRCKVTCTTTGDVTNSSVLAVDMNPFYHCYCASYAFDLIDTKIDSVRLGTIVTGSDPFICESYTDYTGITPASLIPGAPNTIHIVNGSCSSFDDGIFCFCLHRL
jgi:hypothetical protein